MTVSATSVTIPQQRSFDGQMFPLVLRSTTPEPVLADVLQWVETQRVELNAQLCEHGAILFRGFGVRAGADFERVARAVEEELKNEYLGTSPRDAVTESGYVFSASELPPYYPIPQHCEMSFVKTPPRRVFFSCLGPPARGSGETPLCDFRKVWRDLDPELRKRFTEGGIRIVRNYAGPSGGGRFDLWKLKRWDEMFLTTDRARVESKCREQGFEYRWIGKDGLRLVHTQPVYRDHPVTGERVWHNHATTFHLSTAAAEYRRIRELRPTLRNFWLRRFAQAMTALQRRKLPEERALDCTHLDGSAIRDADMEAVRDAVWKHMVIEPWQRGDVVAIDNHSTSHGRLPYRGPRQIAACWA